MNIIQAELDKDNVIDLLTYRSWWYQIHWYGMSYEKARKIYTDAERFEEHERKKS